MHLCLVPRTYCWNQVTCIPSTYRQTIVTYCRLILYDSVAHVTTIVTARLGAMVLYWLVWNIVTVPEYVPLHCAADTRQRAVRVMSVKRGPQDSGPAGPTVRLTLLGTLTLVLNVTPETGGAHLKESPILPELLVPALPEKVMVMGFFDQRALGEELEAKLTAA